MPLMRCTLPGGKRGWKWGKSGKCWASRRQAVRQMRAIYASGYTGNAAAPKPKPNPLRTDPTRLVSLRRRLTADFARRLARLRADLRSLLVRDDALGLRPDWPAAGGVWRALDAAGKLDAFTQWLDTRLTTHLLSGNWWEPYVREAFVRGASRVYDDVRKAALRDPVEHAGGKAEFLRGLLARPWFGVGTGVGVVANALGPLEKLGLLFGQFAAAVKALAGYVAASLTRVLPNLLAGNVSPERLYRELTAALSSAGSRVAAIVVSEATRAHASGQLAGMGALGVVKAAVWVEWVSQFDACPKCRARAGRTYTLEAAEGLLPFHPSCRCAWQVVME